MQTNYTYTNLYPTINYIPLQDYDLMDEVNIRDSLNSKLFSINHQENRINRSLLNIAISNPKYLNEFFSRYSGYVYYKKFQYPIASDYSYRDYFNNEAVHVDINSNWIVFSCNEAGRCEEDQYLVLIFDYEGKLVAPYNYKIRNLQSGLTVYVRKNDLYTDSVLANYNSELLSENYTLKVLVIKKKNVTENLRYVEKSITTSAVTYLDNLSSNNIYLDNLSSNNIYLDNLTGLSSSIINNIDLSNNEMNTILPLIDINYYTIFKKISGDIYYRQLHRSDYNTIVTDNNRLSFNILEDILNDTNYIIMNTIDYSELNIVTNIDAGILSIIDQGSKHFNHDLIQSQFDDVGYVNRIPLVTKIGSKYMPLAFKRVYDIYMWVNGIKLTPGVDFFIDFNDDNNTNPPSIVLCEDQQFPLDNNTHIRIILNQPYHPKNLCAYFDNINDKGSVDFERDIVSYSVNGANLAFSNGRFVSSDQIEVLNNSLLMINNLTTNRRFEYNFNYLVNPDVSNLVDYFNNYESDLNRFIRYSGYSGSIINDYITYNNVIYTLSDTYINGLACTCASSNFSRFVNIEVDRSNIYNNGYVLLVTGLRLNNNIATFDCRRLTPNNNLKYINCTRQNNDCVLVLNCNR